MVIDANIYWFPESLFTDETMLKQFLAEIPQADDTTGFVKTEAGKKQIVVERPVGYASVNYLQGDYELEVLLNALVQAGVDRAVMKVPCCQEWMSVEMCRIFNDGMAKYQKESGGRLIGLAVIPPWGTEAALQELERCVHELDMHGVQLCAHYQGKYLDDKAFTPMFEKLNKYGLTAYIHHTPLPVQYDSLYEYNNLRRSYGRCTDQTIAVSRELLSGMLEKYPDVRLVHSMLGGGFFAYLNMFLPQAVIPGQQADTVQRFDAADGRLRECFRKNLFFEMSHAQPWGKLQLECAVKALGADHVVYGSSYPVRTEWMTEGADFVRSLDISEDEKEQILYRNAVELYQIGDGVSRHVLLLSKI